MIPALLLCLCTGLAAAAETGGATAARAEASAIDTKAMEKDLQQLSWEQFKAVLDAIPKLKADVESYGELGWQFVRANYMHYGWKRNIDRLDEAQKRELAALIEQAKTGTPPVPRDK